MCSKNGDYTPDYTHIKSSRIEDVDTDYGTTTLAMTSLALYFTPNMTWAIFRALFFPSSLPLDIILSTTTFATTDKFPQNYLLVGSIPHNIASQH
jgi:hypothetical protein